MHRFALTLAAAALLQAAPAGAATFLFVRHAESTANAGTATTPEEMKDPPLTELGEQQALDLVDTLKGYDVTDIYVSTYQRTALTIAPTAAHFGLTPTAVDAIKEWDFGTGVLDYDEINAMFGQWLAGNTAAAIPSSPGSESLDDLNARVVPAYNQIAADHADEDGVILIVGHGGSIGWTMPSFAANVDLVFALTNGLHNTGIVEVQLYDGVPYVTNWEGTPIAWPGAPAEVPLPASGLLLLGGAGAVAALRRRKARAAA
ncbi:histidine phosphatase family protein [Pseudooceanicola sp. LIPI14-2-Ac024]|uniref:histidine phosphatase family protein n=1 Tax=Pseudooceanicola sp. LIPI14-2-Ac024 TaxID=3344875 RepID=UPI0035D07341